MRQNQIITVGFHDKIIFDLNDGGDRHKSRIITWTFEQILYATKRVFFYEDKNKKKELNSNEENKN